MGVSKSSMRDSGNVFIVWDVQSDIQHCQEYGAEVESRIGERVRKKSFLSLQTPSQMPRSIWTAMYVSADCKL